MKTPLLDVFHSFHTYIRWCTPSIHPDLPQVKDIYANDMSISLHGIGSPLSDSGIFGEATKLAAPAYHADHTLFCVQGTTTSNFMVMRALKYQLGDLKVLGSRNAHMSIVTACRDYDIEYIPIEPQYDQKLQLFTPNTVEQIMDGIHEHQPNVLFLSNPTYEGNSLDLPVIIKTVRQQYPSLIIYVDEGWGAHFCFSDKLPASAMQSGADICTQSTHKQGNSLQENSMIHWKDGRIDNAEVMRAYRSLSTTSPSFHLLAALDGTRAFMQERGAQIIDDAIAVGAYFVDQLKAVPEVEVSIASDPTKLLLHFPEHDVLDIAKRLEADKIVVEKYEARNITIVVGYQCTNADVDTTVASLKQILKQIKPVAVDFPKFPTAIQRKSPASDAPTQAISLQEAVGRISDEYVIPYPPGIPLLAPGEVIRQEHIDYILAAQAQSELITVFMSAPDTLRVR